MAHIAGMSEKGIYRDAPNLWDEMDVVNFDRTVFGSTFVSNLPQEDPVSHVRLTCMCKGSLFIMSFVENKHLDRLDLPFLVFPNLEVFDIQLHTEILALHMK
jgi:hypothetical protein